LKIVIAGALTILCCAGAAAAQINEVTLNGLSAGYTALSIAPSATDPRISAGTPDHAVMYDRRAKAGNLLLFMTGTGGVPPGPVRFLNRAIQRGYRVISLSYIDSPAVGQTCIGATVQADPDCAQQFRQKRIYGDDTTQLINDSPADAIVNRFVKLLQYLAINDPQGSWGQYLDGNSPNWSRIAVAGQSQGGGMAEFIAQRQPVARVIAFSGGWDTAGHREVAAWYLGKSKTPPGLWYATYNVAEPEAAFLARTYVALRVPAAQVFPLALPVREGQQAHTEGVADPAYQDVWDKLLGSGTP
jgi:hypothetical protein